MVVLSLGTAGAITSPEAQAARHGKRHSAHAKRGPSSHGKHQKHAKKKAKGKKAAKKKAHRKAKGQKKRPRHH